MNTPVSDSASPASNPENATPASRLPGAAPSLSSSAAPVSSSSALPSSSASSSALLLFLQQFLFGAFFQFVLRVILQLQQRFTHPGRHSMPALQRPMQ